MTDDLRLWAAYRTSLDAEPASVRALLERLRAWKIQHDQDRARQPGPFLQLAWDAVFGDEDAQVMETIRQIEATLAS